MLAATSVAPAAPTARALLSAAMSGSMPKCGSEGHVELAARLLRLGNLILICFIGGNKPPALRDAKHPEALVYGSRCPVLVASAR
jgi:hypothetical protein